MPHMHEVVAAIEKAAPESAGRITFEDFQLPFPPEVDGSGLERAIGKVTHRPLEEGVAETVEMFRELIDKGRIDPDAYIKERS